MEARRAGCHPGVCMHAFAFRVQSSFAIRYSNFASEWARSFNVCRACSKKQNEQMKIADEKPVCDIRG
eukprot:4213708-Amphidinium_carterae.1